MSLKHFMDNNKIVVAYTTDKHLLLDLDHTEPFKVMWLIGLLMFEYSDIGDCLLMQSNLPRNINYTIIGKTGIPKHVTMSFNYHVIFDNIIPYSRSCEIIEALAAVDILNKDYAKIRKFRGDMSLRISPRSMLEGIDKAPILLTYIENKYTKIHDYMCKEYWDAIKCIYDLIFLTENPKAIANNSSNSSNYRSKHNAIYT